MFKSNFLTVLGSTIINASIPFIFLGMMYSDTLACVSVGIAVSGLIGLIAGIVRRNSLADLPWVKDMLLDLGFPYAFILSMTISYYAGMTDIASDMWIMVAFAVFILAGYALKRKNKNS